MKPIETTSKVEPDGNLRVVVPIGADQVGQEFRISITPAPRQLTREEWIAFVKRTAGSIDDPTFVRPPQPPHKPPPRFEE